MMCLDRRPTDKHNVNLWMSFKEADDMLTNMNYSNKDSYNYFIAKIDDYNYKISNRVTKKMCNLKAENLSTFINREEVRVKNLDIDMYEEYVFELDTTKEIWEQSL